MTARRLRIRIVATHPIQYQAPWFRAIARRPDCDLEVWFCHRATPAEQRDAGFGVPFEWDVPLLDGYRHRFLDNRARRPDLHRFGGLNAPSLADDLRADPPDVLVVHGWYYRAAWQGIMAAWRLGIPVLIRGDSIVRPAEGARAAVTALARRLFVPRFDGCLAAGVRSREYFVRCGADPDRVFVVPHTIDLERFAADTRRLEATRDRLRLEMNLDADRTVFLFAGKLVGPKRPLEFIDALGAAARVAPVAGLVAGDGPLRAACERLARERRVPVHFLGFVNQSAIARAYVASDVLVLGSATETWGLVVNEAQACGRAVLVAENVGCVPDLVDPGRTGFTFPLDDRDALVACMTRLTFDPKRREAMGEAARRQAAHWAPTAAAASLVHAVRRVAVRAKVPA